jgi:hypothetical protein
MTFLAEMLEQRALNSLVLDQTFFGLNWPGYWLLLEVVYRIRNEEYMLGSLRLVSYMECVQDCKRAMQTCKAGYGRRLLRSISSPRFLRDIPRIHHSTYHSPRNLPRSNSIIKMVAPTFALARSTAAVRQFSVLGRSFGSVSFVPRNVGPSRLSLIPLNSA